MIKVTYYPEYRQLTIEGHAGAGEMGHDLVCAAASGIWHTLAVNAMVWKDNGYLMDLRMQEIEGYCKLSFVPRAKWKNLLATIAGAIVLGLEDLAARYPEHIEFRRLGQG